MPPVLQAGVAAARSVGLRALVGRREHAVAELLAIATDDDLNVRRRTHREDQSRNPMLVWRQGATRIEEIPVTATCALGGSLAGWKGQNHIAATFRPVSCDGNAVCPGRPFAFGRHEPDLERGTAADQRALLCRTSHLRHAHESEAECDATRKTRDVWCPIEAIVRPSVPATAIVAITSAERYRRSAADARGSEATDASVRLQRRVGQPSLERDVQALESATTTEGTLEHRE